MACWVVEPSDAIFGDPARVKKFVGERADRWGYVSAISATVSRSLLVKISARDLTPRMNLGRDNLLKLPDSSDFFRIL